MRPPIFVDLDLDTALARAAEHGRPLLVDATARSCGPCEVMDRTTWVDPKLTAAFAERVIAIQVDVDVDVDVARRLRIKALPSIVAFVNSAERERVVGFQTSADLVAWVDALLGDETSLERLRRDVAAAPRDMRARMDLARALVEAGELAAATDEFVWLWQRMLEHDPSMHGIRSSLLVRAIGELALAHPPARERFAALRDAAAPDSGKLDRARVGDWLFLNRALGEADASVAWFEANRARAVDGEALLGVLESEIVPLLTEAGRWSDVATLYPEPLERLKASVRERDRMLELASTEGGPWGEHLASVGRRSVREVAVRLVRALRAAARRRDADDVVAEALALDTSPAMAAALAELDEGVS